jgi:hypothetical protein
MHVIIHPDEAQLQVRIDLQDATSPIAYQYGNFTRWRTTPFTTAHYLLDAECAMADVYEFFDRQWRGC